MQTVLGAYWYGHNIPYNARQHLVLFDDGDQIVLHDDRPKGWKPGDRTVLLIHGLGGSHSSGYIVRIAHTLNSLGIRTFRVDLRGCGAGHNLAKRPFHAGCSDDIAHCVEAISALCMGSPLTLCGFSMGANIALKLAGEMGNGRIGGIDSVMAVAPPIDLAHCCTNMNRGFNRLYDWDFSRRLVSLVEGRLAQDENFYDGFRFTEKPARLIEFDSVFTAPQCGFDSAEDYYAKASAAFVLPDVKVPGLILTADDDSVVPVQIFDKHPRSGSVELEITRGGGHLGFITSKSIVPDRRWMDHRVVQWIASLDSRKTISRKELSSADTCSSPV
ncbi:YheT family hydrolase [Bremerella alba]|uniref:YheT family hydrolase n=1 Tax=Bremerella alba TaxID=980252 RepID=UPI001A954471|nr:alpha/beta fold hydrolase [Bremerella alba]